MMRTTPIQRLLLLDDGTFRAESTNLATALVPSLVHARGEFPTVVIERGHGFDAATPCIEIAHWQSGRAFALLDAAVVASTSTSLALRGPHRELAQGALEVLTRYQRFVDRKNGASQNPRFEAFARARRQLDVQRAVAYEYERAIDTWQWVLRLSPNAGQPVQLAAIFHDLGQLESNDEHTRSNAAWMRRTLVHAGVDEVLAERTSHLVAAERPDRGTDAALLRDAEMLSFLSLGSAFYADTFGPHRLRERLATSLRRLGDGARARIASVRLRWDVKRAFDGAWAAAA